MSASIPAKECAECGMEGSHTLLWIDNFTDGILLYNPLISKPFYQKVMNGLGYILDAFGFIFFWIGLQLHIISLSKDSKDAISDRSQRLLQEAIRQDINASIVCIAGKATDIFYVQSASNHQFFKSLPFSPDVSSLRMDDKVLFKEKMSNAHIPVPKSHSTRTYEQARKALRDVQIACIKPRTGSNGRHTYPYVRTEKELKYSFKSVKQIAPFVTVEEYLEGDLCRATCIDGYMYGFLQSAYPSVKGDGTSSISQLIERANTNRAADVSEIVLDSVTQGFIERQGYSIEAVLERDKALPLTYRGGAGSGGSNYEHGRNIHPSFIPIIELAAKETGLIIVGFDLIIPDPQKPENEQKWGFIEANSLPWIDLHAHPYSGTPVDLSVPVWDLWLTKNAIA